MDPLTPWNSLESFYSVIILHNCLFLASIQTHLGVIMSLQLDDIKFLGLLHKYFLFCLTSWFSIIRFLVWNHLIFNYDFNFDDIHLYKTATSLLSPPTLSYLSATPLSSPPSWQVSFSIIIFILSMLYCFNNYFLLLHRIIIEL